jgi:hypothetical protein
VIQGVNSRKWLQSSGQAIAFAGQRVISHVLGSTCRDHAGDGRLRQHDFSSS